MSGRSRRYRTKIEVLRDFLEAARTESRKSRIIGIANLNLVLFRRYLEFATSLDLVASTSGGYRLTPRAGPALDAIERFLIKSEEAELALADLRRICGDGNGYGRPRATVAPEEILQFLAPSRLTEVGRATLDPPIQGSGTARSPGPSAQGNRPPEWWLAEPDRAAAPPSPPSTTGSTSAEARPRPTALHRDRGAGRSTRK